MALQRKTSTGQGGQKLLALLNECHIIISLLTKGLTPQKLTVTVNGLLDLKTAGLTRAPNTGG